MQKFVLFSSILALVVLFSFSANFAFAHPHSGMILINDHTHNPETEIIPLSPTIGLEKSTLFFHTPEENMLPWGFVEGKIANHVQGYPVIIQIFKDNDAVHFAQTGVKDDGHYEYKFRVLSSDNDLTTKFFEGNYSVKIFKVVYLNPSHVI